MNSKIRIITMALVLTAALFLAAGCTQQPASSGTTIPPTTAAVASAATTSASQAAATPTVSTATWKKARLSTTMGDIVIALDPDMPVTAGNFEKLVGSGFYNNVTFHRIINGFMIQGGDPTGTGRGGPGYTIKDEFKTGNRNDRGTISMANAGPNTGGSQFFINLANNNALDTKHPVFGKVIEGMDVVDTIAKVPTSGGNEGRPLQPVMIIKAEMI